MTRLFFQSFMLCMKTLLLIPAVVFVVLLNSCKKDHSIDLKPNLNVADNIVIAEETYNHIVLMTIRSWKDPLLISQGHIYIDSGYVIYDSLQNKISIYYFNKLSPDSITRQGAVEVQMSGNILLKGSYASVRFTNYNCNMNMITGNDSIVNAGTGADGKMIFVNFITEGVITKLTNYSILWQSSNRFKVDPSVFTGGTGNYYVLISGDASGTSTKGYGFTAVISDSLIYRSECPWLAGDKINIGISGVDVPAGWIKFNTMNSCSDELEYDFEGNFYYTRMNMMYLKH
jgi:hypothetical protein